MERVIAETEKTVLGIFDDETAGEYFATDASIASIARINLNKLLRYITKLTQANAVKMSERMVGGLDRQSKVGLKSSLKKISEAMELKGGIDLPDVRDAFTASVNVNVDLIKTMTGDYVSAVRGAVNRSIQRGGGLESLIPDIEKFLKKEALKTRNKAKNVALDQTRKAYSALNSARMRRMNLQEFEWVHSGGGQRPRELHKIPYPDGLNGGIFSLDDPPVIDEKTGERGIPGQLPNCECTMRPIVRFDEG